MGRGKGDETEKTKNGFGKTAQGEMKEALCSGSFPGGSSDVCKRD